jgi:hypothetical protein
VTKVDPNAHGFFDAVFDGRYVYLVPYANSGTFPAVVPRYDTQADFTSVGSWSAFTLTPVSPSASGYISGAFDGRFVYFVPWFFNGAESGHVARYDTLAPFGGAASWSTFDTSTLTANAVSFQGAVFDGEYLYLEPSGSTVTRFHARSPSQMPNLPQFHGSFL